MSSTKQTITITQEDGTKKQMDIPTFKPSNNNKAEIDTHTTDISVLNAQVAGLASNAAGQNAYEQATTLTTTINDTNFTDIAEYDLNDNSNEINNWETKLAKVFYDLESDGTQDYTVKLEIEYQGERSIVREKFITSSSERFLTNQYTLALNDTQWDAMDSNQKLQSIIDGDLPYNIKIILSAQLGDLTTSNGSGYTPTNLWSGDTQINLGASFSSNTFTLSDSVAVGDYLNVTINSNDGTNNIDRVYLLQTTTQNGNTYSPTVLDYNGTAILSIWNVFGNELKVYVDNSTSNTITIKNVETAEAPTTFISKYGDYILSTVVMEIVDRSATLSNEPALREAGDNANKALIDSKITYLTDANEVKKGNIIIGNPLQYEASSKAVGQVFIVPETNEIYVGNSDGGELAKK